MVGNRARCTPPRLAVVLLAATTLAAALIPAHLAEATERLRIEPEGERITVHAVAVHASEVVAGLREAGIADLVGPAELGRPVTIHVESGTVERVMRHLLQQVGVTNHAVRYDGDTGMATFVVVDESGTPVRVAREGAPRREGVPRREAPPPSEPTPKGPSPEELRGAPEQGFGRLLLGR